MTENAWSANEVNKEISASHYFSIFQETVANNIPATLLGEIKITHLRRLVSTNGFTIAMLRFSLWCYLLHLFSTDPKHLMLLGNLNSHQLYLLSPEFHFLWSFFLSFLYRKSSLTSSSTKFLATFSIIHPPIVLTGWFHSAEG